MPSPIFGSFDCVYDNSSGNFSKIIQDNESMNRDYRNHNVYVDKDKEDIWSTVAQNPDYNRSK